MDDSAKTTQIDIAVDPKTEDEIKNNLLKLLEKKKISLQMSSDCHEAISAKYRRISRTIEYGGLTLLSLSFILSTVMGGGECAHSINIPWTVTTGLIMVLRGSKQVVDYTSLANAHEICHKAALDLADDIEYIILKNNHTKKSLQQSLEVYEERIKSFRKIEEPLPLSIKQKFIPNH